MLRSSVLIFTLFACCFLAHAETFTLSFNDGTSHTLQLIGNQSALGTYNVTSASGSLDGHAITLAYAGSFEANDNVLLFPKTNGMYLDLFGLSFNLANGPTYNLYYDSDPLAMGYRALLADNTARVVNQLTVSANESNVLATPEPESLVLLGTGLFGIFLLIRQRNWERTFSQGS